MLERPQPQADVVKAQQAARDHLTRAANAIPPMRVVTKGLWIHRETRVPLEDLEKADRDLRTAG